MFCVLRRWQNKNGNTVIKSGAGHIISYFSKLNVGKNAPRDLGYAIGLFLKQSAWKKSEVSAQLQQTIKVRSQSEVAASGFTLKILFELPKLQLATLTSDDYFKIAPSHLYWTEDACVSALAVP